MGFMASPWEWSLFFCQYAYKRGGTVTRFPGTLLEKNYPVKATASNLRWSKSSNYLGNRFTPPLFLFANNQKKKKKKKKKSRFKPPLKKKKKKKKKKKTPVFSPPLKKKKKKKKKKKS